MLRSLSPLEAALLPRCSFPPPGSDVALAVSGGADSLCLLALAGAAGCRATAYHVDHGLRAGSAGEAALVAGAAGRLGAGFVALTVDIRPGPNLEARARLARYANLPAGVATGHTADDQAETILLNLLRGASTDGLAGMRSGTRHPILRLRRFETHALCAELGLEVVEDPSNDDRSYMRNLVRHELLPALAKASDRDLVPVLCRQASHFAAESDFLDNLSLALDPSDAKALASAPVVLARRSVRRWLRSTDPEGHPPGSAAVERVLSVARGEALACEIPGGTRVRRRSGRLVLVPAAVPGGTTAAPGEATVSPPAGEAPSSGGPVSPAAEPSPPPVEVTANRPGSTDARAH
ncbi:MAG: tRNA lysidine(34) synthetase TilS [Acidimicrobiales bacterium]